MRNFNHSLIGILLLSALPLQAADRISFYETKSRPAEELLGIVRNLFGPDLRISAVGNRIVVNASPGATEKVLAALSELDRAPRSLELEARVLSQGEASREGIGARIDSRGVGVDIASQSRQHGGHGAQVVRTLEGSRAYIGADFGSFYVKARFSGENAVVLELQKGEQAGLRYFFLQSEVTAKLGEWTEVGSLDQSTERSGSGILRKENGNRSEKRTVQVRVRRAD